LKRGFSVKSDHIGRPKSSMHFVWRIPAEETETNLLCRNLEVISAIKKEMPTFQRRITKTEFRNALGFAVPSHFIKVKK